MSLTLLDWRRRVAALYAEIRSATDIVAAHELWCRTREDLFRTHPDSPLLPADRDNFAGLAVAPYDPDLRFEVELDRDVPPARWEVPTGTDGIVAFTRMGRLHLPGLGQAVTVEGSRQDAGDLDVWWLASYGGGVFVPVKDALAGRGTYGGGRYVIDSTKGADLGGDGATIVLDLNFAYNPSCAYDPAWACPLAPAGNVLPTSVRAGELTRYHR